MALIFISYSFGSRLWLITADGTGRPARGVAEAAPRPDFEAGCVGAAEPGGR